METAHPLDELICTTNLDPYAKYPTLIKKNPDPVVNTVDAYTRFMETNRQNKTTSLSGQDRDFKQQYVERLEQLIAWQEDPLFDTKILIDFDKTRDYLLTEEGFEEVKFETDDGVILGGLLKERKNARFNVVVANGFMPGKKEGMATLYKLFPDFCNLLLFDARGHGNSDGHLWRNILWKRIHGLNEYRDIWAAIRLMNTRFSTIQSNILYGTCEGAFHSANAVLEAKKQDTLAELKIKALFFDSGWDKFVEAGYSVARQKLTGIVGGPAYYAASALYQLWLKGAYRPIENERNLPHRINNLPESVRTVFIHGIEDKDVPIQGVRALYAKCPNSVMYESNVTRPHALMQVKDKFRYALWLRQELEKLEKSKIE